MSAKQQSFARISPVPTGKWVAAACFLAALASTAPANEPSVPQLVEIWHADFGHQFEADGICVRDGFAYVGTGGQDARIAKLDIASGEVKWAYETRQTYQPSFPVSNGNVVVFGQYGDGKIIGLDDATGAKRWEVPALHAMSAARFDRDVAYIASTNDCVYAIEWATGNIRWKSRLGGGFWSKPCVVDNRVFVACYDRYVYGLDPATGKMEVAIECAGRIRYDPFVSHGLIFLAADHQWFTDRFDTDKQFKEMTIIDARAGKIVDRLTTDNRFGPRIVERQGVVYFYDFDKLYAYDPARRKRLWTAKAPPEMRPFPLFEGSQIVLAMNELGREGQHETVVVTLDPRTGEVARSTAGGIGMHHFGHYAQVGDLVLITDYRLACYRIVTAPQGR